MKKTLTKLVLPALLGLWLLTPSTASAQSNLLDLLQKLHSQIQTLNQATQNVRETMTLVRELRQGMSGEDVKALQALLAADAEIYPEGLITGFFGKLTENAVKRFQTKKQLGLNESGRVGPGTREILNSQLADTPLADENTNEGKRLCAIIPPGHLIAKGWLRKNDGVRPIVPACQTLPPGISRQLTTGTSTTPTGTDNKAPVLSRIVATSTTATGSTITWKTNELADSTLRYGTSTPLTTGASTYLFSPTLILQHELNLSGLTASTTYYFQVSSADAARNSSTSTIRSFQTL